jgi:prostaglandin-endoperoxide synthase 2
MDGFLMWLAGPVFWLANRWNWLGRRLNKVLINGLVNVCRSRPHPWSTVHDYVSWTSLTEQRWSARHLPAVYTTGLPDATLLLDVFRRPADKSRYCAKSTLLFPAFAQYLTDGFIRTKMKRKDDPDSVLKENTSNHQIDLSPLYGRTMAQTAALRLRSATPGERGRLKSQRINGDEYAPYLMDATGAIASEFKVLDEPLGLDNQTDPELRARIFAFGGDRANASPQVSMINTLFLREHNRLAAEIEKLNPSWDDDRVFETARNITIVIFLKIVIEDYINHITPTPFRFRADPSTAWTAKWNRPNWITAEFSLLYRWHSLIPDTVEWNGETLPVKATFMDNRPLLKAGLARAFTDISAQRAGCLGAFNTPEALLPVEKKAIDQGRLVALAPFGDYRAYVGLKPPKRFRSVTKDRAAAALLDKIYGGDVAKLDFYVGLFAEKPMKNSPLPPLIMRMVAMDAFSQALTNPLLSEHVFKPETFTAFGWRTIETTASLQDVLSRNVTGEIGRVSMTQDGWRPR